MSKSLSILVLDILLAFARSTIAADALTLPATFDFKQPKVSEGCEVVQPDGASVTATKFTVEGDMIRLSKLTEPMNLRVSFAEAQ